MRRLGPLPSEADARRFREYMAVRDVEVSVQAAGVGCEVWVLDEDDLDVARAELKLFASEPMASRYVEAEAESTRRRQQAVEAALAEHRSTIVERRRTPRTPWRSSPVTLLVIVLCGMAAAATRFGEDRSMRGRLHISEYQPTTSGVLGLPEIRRGEVWRLVTPSFLHFDVLHLLGNVSWFYLFGQVIERTRRRGRYVLMLILIALVSNLAQYLVAGPNFGGLSGVDCGLFGFLWFKSHFRPEAGFELAPEQTVLFAGWMLVCLTGIVGPIANTAHVSGLILGLLLALPRSVPVFRRKPAIED
ncbi:MAG: rhomboid family intramembrane serine protease [Planctomycetaceae bacterium]|nr:rhomboid family intramembrane serine protease [Planctomycetaceae bacterium]